MLSRQTGFCFLLTTSLTSFSKSCHLEITKCESIIVWTGWSVGERFLDGCGLVVFTENGIRGQQLCGVEYLLRASPTVSVVKPQNIWRETETERQRNEEEVKMTDHYCIVWEN